MLQLVPSMTTKGLHAAVGLNHNQERGCMLQLVPIMTTKRLHAAVGLTHDQKGLCAAVGPNHEHEGVERCCGSQL